MIGILRINSLRLVCIIGCLYLFFVPSFQWAVNVLNITDVTEWRQSWDHFRKITAVGNYIYSTVLDGLLVTDMSNPASPVIVKKVPGGEDYKGWRPLEIQGNRAYTVGGGKLYVYDITEPGNPSLLGSTDLPRGGDRMGLSKNTAYIAAGLSGPIDIFDISGEGLPTYLASFDMGEIRHKHLQARNNILAIATGYEGVKLYDISSPGSPKSLADIPNKYNGRCFKVHLSGNLLYVLEERLNLLIYDISNPQSPVKLGEYSEDIPGQRSGFWFLVHIEGGIAFLMGNDKLTILDISNPAAPARLSRFTYGRGDYQFNIVNNIVYLNGIPGLRVIDVSNPSNPTQIAIHGDLGYTRDYLKDGNMFYMAKEFGMKILDLSDISSPTLTASTLLDNDILSMEMKNGYLYMHVKRSEDERLLISNMADPANPVISSDTDIEDVDFRGIALTGQYVYMVSRKLLLVYDVSDPSSPVRTASIAPGGASIHLDGNNAYLVENFKIRRLDISSPASPVFGNDIEFPSQVLLLSAVSKDQYLYVSDINGGVLAMDITDPASPVLLKTFDSDHYLTDFIIEGNTAYTMSSSGVMAVLDVSAFPPTLKGYKSTGNYARVMYGDNGYLFYSTYFNYASTLYISRYQEGHAIPAISVNRHTVNVAGVKGGAETPEEEVRVDAPDSTYWRAITPGNWLYCYPRSGNGGNTFAIFGSYRSFAPGHYTETMTLYNYYCIFDSQTIGVNLQVYGENQTTIPFGQLSTPIQNTNVSGSIPVTGWALDDIGITGVKIYLETGGPLHFTGDAVFVEGARPDVEQAYPNYPGNTRAGWGYMLLTHSLPGGGNGRYTIHAIATDVEGNETTLGTRTFVCDNAGAVKPFGAIDTPTQGGLASGSKYINWGWALTPQPNAIPTDGSTINVWVDGVNLGHPVYNLYREDIATLLPGYANSDGAVGYYYLDTAAYDNGVHTIQWTVRDNAGNTDGVGSRYFTVQNSSWSRAAVSSANSSPAPFTPSLLDRFPIDTADPVRVKRGFGKTKPVEVLAGETGYYILETAELEPLEIAFPETSQVLWGVLTAGELVKPLPIGSTLDKGNNRFLWSPGPGFVGDYTLVFLEEHGDGSRLPKKIIIRIMPKNH